MKKGWGIALGLILAAVILVLVAVKLYRYRVALRLTPPAPPLSKEEKKIPSMLRALPFKKQVRRKKSLLEAKLKPEQILITNVLANPKGAPKGLYLQVSLVLEFPSEKLAQEYQEQKAKVKEVIVTTIQKLPYRDLRSSEGPNLLKEELKKILPQQRIQIRSLWLTTFKFQQIKRL